MNTGRLMHFARSFSGFLPGPKHRQLRLQMESGKPHRFTWDRWGKRGGIMLVEGLLYADQSP